MGTLRCLILLAISALACGLPAFGQDSSSLADVARAARLQKQKSAQASDPAAGTPDVGAKTPRVITNDEIPEHVEADAPSGRSGQSQSSINALSNYGQRKLTAAEWKAEIQAQKTAIASRQGEISTLSASIHFPVSCLRNCVQRNERQVQKENRVEVRRNWKSNRSVSKICRKPLVNRATETRFTIRRRFYSPFFVAYGLEYRSTVDKSIPRIMFAE